MNEDNDARIADALSHTAYSMRLILFVLFAIAALHCGEKCDARRQHDEHMRRLDAMMEAKQ